MANSIWGAGTSAGLVVTVPLVAWLTLWLGWRWTFLVTGLIGFVWTVAWLALFWPPREHSRVTAAEREMLEDDARIGLAFGLLVPPGADALGRCQELENPGWGGVDPYFVLD